MEGVANEIISTSLGSFVPLSVAKAKRHNMLSRAHETASAGSSEDRNGRARVIHCLYSSRVERCSTGFPKCPVDGRM